MRRVGVAPLAARVPLAAASRSSLGAAGGRAQQPRGTTIDDGRLAGPRSASAAAGRRSAQRVIVVLKPPSLADRVRAAGGHGDRGGDARVDGGGGRAAGAVPRAPRGGRASRIAPEYRYTRVVNGFSAALDPTCARAARARREVAGVYPVRVAYPASGRASRGRRARRLGRRRPRARRASTAAA